MAESIRNLSNFNFQWTNTLYQIISMTWNNSKEKVLIIQEPEKTNFKSFDFHKFKITQFPDGLSLYIQVPWSDWERLFSKARPQGP